MDKDNCPYKAKHTPMPPGNDENLRDYKEKLGRSHYTLACQGCGLWVIWVLKTTINFEGAVILR